MSEWIFSDTKCRSRHYCGLSLTSQNGLPWHLFVSLVNVPGADLGMTLGHSVSLVNVPGALGVTLGHSVSSVNVPGALEVTLGHSEA